MATEPTVRVAVAFHSDHGHVAKLAHNVAAGAEKVDGAVATVLALQDQDLDDDAWGALERADAIVFGAPTYMDGPSAVFKRFAEATLPIWARQGWRSKVAAGFTHSQAMSGDKLNTLQYFSILAAQHGMVWVNLDLLPGWAGRLARRDEPVQRRWPPGQQPPPRRSRHRRPPGPARGHRHPRPGPRPPATATASWVLAGSADHRRLAGAHMSARITSQRALQNAQVMLEVFKAVQRRDAQRFAELVHPEFEIHWPPSLPRVVAASDQEVVVLWRQRGRNPAGERFDTPVLGLYQLRDGRLTRAQMFYFDTVAVAGFLAAAAGDAHTEGHMHPNARLIEAFSQAQRRFYAGDDDTATLRGLLRDDIAWHVSGRSAIAGDYRGHDQVLGYFAARRKLARASFRVEPHGLLADEHWVVQFATGRLERDGRVSRWQTLGVYRIAQGKIAECWLVPFDQYQFDQIWSVQA